MRLFWTNQGTRHESATLARLEALQQRHRLGIHIWEKRQGFAFPTESQALFPSAAEQAHDSIKPQVSISLLPRFDEGILAPYGCRDHNLNAGYLLDLDETQPDGARILAASDSSMVSGDDSSHKRWRIKDEGVTLDTMARAYANRWACVVGRATRFNEAILVGRAGQRCGIVVPYRLHDKTAWYGPAHRLTAAANGLQHYENSGVILPVVSYPVSGSKHQKLSIIAETPEEMRAVIGHALKELMIHPKIHRDWQSVVKGTICESRYNQRFTINDYLRNSLGIDATAAYNTQSRAIGELTQGHSAFRNGR